MKKYHFYIKGDVNKEPVSILKAKNLTDAIDLFCLQKKLEKKNFLELFEVELN